MNRQKLKEIFEKKTDEEKKQILYDNTFIEENELDNSDLEYMIHSLGEDTRIKVLEDETLIRNQFYLFDRNIYALARSLSNEEEKNKILKMYQLTSDTKIKIDFERDLEDYRGLDDAIRINPTEFDKEQMEKFKKLFKICPELQVVNTICDWGNEYASSASEYLAGEAWIENLIGNLNPAYSKAQKLAVIDHAIGKKISYRPDFETEVCNQNDCQALWKVISSGYGVCGGIAKVEQYILAKVGIESEYIVSKQILNNNRHAFLKIKEIEFPLANGETIKGNTVLDPTWNLTSHRFNGFPENFCISYEEARKNDIDPEGNDSFCHLNDEKLQDATLHLDEQSLRNLFQSVGLTDREGQFPIGELWDKSEELHEKYQDNSDQNIKEQFSLLAKTCPEFMTCQNSSMDILTILLDHEKLPLNRCVINRAYARSDEAKKPTFYVYVDSDEIGKKFYCASGEKGEALEFAPEEFTKQFECYEEDLKKSNGVRPWEEEQKQAKVDLPRSSGKVAAQEGAER